MKCFCFSGLLVVALCVVSASNLPAKGLDSVDDAVALSDKVMEKVVADDIDGVSALIKPYSTLDFADFNFVNKRTSDFFKMRPSSFGEPLNYVFVKKEVIAETLLRVTYIERLKRKPLQWDFLFYKPEKEWLFWDYSFHASPVTMFGVIIPPSTQNRETPPR